MCNGANYYFITNGILHELNYAHRGDRIYTLVPDANGWFKVVSGNNIIREYLTATNNALLSKEPDGYIFELPRVDKIESRGTRKIPKDILKRKNEQFMKKLKAKVLQLEAEQTN